MARPSNREKIIEEGLRVVHEYGYANSSVRDISRAASVPLGSFTNHFSSKEAFGVEILERYYQSSKAAMDATLGDRTKSIRQRLDLYFEHIFNNLLGPDFSSGCLIGNFCAEVANQSDVLRAHLSGILEQMRYKVLVFLVEGVESGELPADLDTERVCGLIYTTLQGAILVSKVLRSAGPLENCRNHITKDILKLV